MALEFKFPDVGEGVTEGTLLKWLVKPGDKVKIDQPIAEIETDKAVVEVPSPRDGEILFLPWNPKETIEVGRVLCVIGDIGEKFVPSKNYKEKSAKPDEHKSVSVVGNVDEKTITLPSPVQKKSGSDSSAKKIVALPKTRKLAQELNVNLENVLGTGKNMEITEEDVRKIASNARISSHIQKTHIAPVYDFSKYGTVDEIPLSATRKAIAEHMLLSVHSAPHAVAMEEADVTALSGLREKDKLKAEKEKIHLTFLPYIVKAVVSALKQHPHVNSSLDEKKNTIIVKHYYNIGIAVDSDAGLMVPVIKNADKKSVFEIAKEINELAEKARSRKISLEEMKGGTFTLTNYGSIAGTFGVPIINYPEAAILGLGRIKEMPRVISGKDLLGKTKIEPRKILPLSLSFDHRIVDGAEAARFLKTLISYLEEAKFS